MHSDFNEYDYFEDLMTGDVEKPPRQIDIFDLTFILIHLGFILGAVFYGSILCAILGLAMTVLEVYAVYLMRKDDEA